MSTQIKKRTRVKRFNAKRVARRALILGAVICRCFSDINPSNDSKRAAEGEALRIRLTKWVANLSMQGEIEEQENSLLIAPIGTLKEKDRIRGTWLAEDLAILVWALGLSEFPRLDKQVDPYAVTDTLYFLHEDAKLIVDEATLRPIQELKACREVMYAFHCRLEDFRRHRTARNIANWFEVSWLDLLGIKDILTVDGDLRIGGNPITEVDEITLSSCRSLALGRHRAIIWLVEDRGIYSKTHVDT